MLELANLAPTAWYNRANTCLWGPPPGLTGDQAGGIAHLLLKLIVFSCCEFAVVVGVVVVADESAG